MSIRNPPRKFYLSHEWVPLFPSFLQLNDDRAPIHDTNCAKHLHIYGIGYLIGAGLE